jgi:hypothetical protein
MASVTRLDRPGRRHGSGTASRFLANLETVMRNYRWIFLSDIEKRNESFAMS